MSNKVKSPLMKKAPTYSLRASIISILIGLLTGAVVILIVGAFNPLISLKGAWDGIRLVLFGVLSTGRDAAGALTFGFNPTNIGNMLFRATPLILTGVSVAVAFKTGLFNIGAPGQYLAGTTASLFLALSIPSSSVPAWLIWFIAFLGGVLAGALWGAIPGLLKATLNINEVIACIMTNWIAASLVTWLFDISNLKNMVEGNKTGYVYKTTYNGVATSKMGLDKLFPGSQVNGGIIIAIIMAILVYIMLEKTTFGYELKACGANRHAARYAGIHDRRNIVCSMSQRLITERYHGDESKKDIQEKDTEYLARSRAAAEYCARTLGWHRIECTAADANGAKTMRSVEDINAEILAELAGIL